MFVWQRCYVSDNSHGDTNTALLKIPPLKRDLFSRGSVVIGNNVWIGRCVTILSGITIGDNVIVGANSVVLHDIPPNSVAVGSPAKVIKHFGEDTF